MRKEWRPAPQASLFSHGGLLYNLAIDPLPRARSPSVGAAGAALGCRGVTVAMGLVLSSFPLCNIGELAATIVPV